MIVLLLTDTSVLINTYMYKMFFGVFDYVEKNIANYCNQ